MTNAEYKALGTSAGKRAALAHSEMAAARAWFEHVGDRADASPGGRHLFEAAYELSYTLVVRSELKQRVPSYHLALAFLLGA